MIELYGMDEFAILTKEMTEGELKLSLIHISNRPVIRKDLDDAVYKTKKEKYNAVVEEVVKAHEKGSR